MRKWLFLLWLISLLLAAHLARAQDIALASLEIDIWPEYDKPTVLIIYRVTLPADISLPVELAFRIPAAAGEPNAVAAQQVDGSLFNIKYERQVLGEEAIIRLTAPSQRIQLEYYDPGLEKDAAQRYYVYRWPGDYSVQSLSIQVQEPLGASAMKLLPSFGSGVVGQDGLTYYNAEIGTVLAGDEFEITLNYTKDNEILSVEGLQIRPIAPIPQDGTNDTEWLRYLPWMLGLLGLALIFGGNWLFWVYWRRNAPPSGNLIGHLLGFSPPGEKKVSTQPTTDSVPVGEDSIYCHQCGRRAQIGDRFCRSCGTRLRIE